MHTVLVRGYASASRLCMHACVHVCMCVLDQLSHNTHATCAYTHKHTYILISVQTPTLTQLNIRILVLLPKITFSSRSDISTQPQILHKEADSCRCVRYTGDNTTHRYAFEYSSCQCVACVLRCEAFAYARALYNGGDFTLPWECTCIRECVRMQHAAFLWIKTSCICVHTHQPAKSMLASQEPCT